jgi:hypothetical protein
MQLYDIVLYVVTGWGEYVDPWRPVNTDVWIVWVGFDRFDCAVIVCSRV